MISCDVRFQFTKYQISSVICVLCDPSYVKFAHEFLATILHTVVSVEKKMEVRQKSRIFRSPKCGTERDHGVGHPSGQNGTFRKNWKSAWPWEGFCGKRSQLSDLG